MASYPGMFRWGPMILVSSIASDVLAPPAGDACKALSSHGPLPTGTSAWGLIDNLTFSYSGNYPTKVSDSSAGAVSGDFHFYDGANASAEYAYDANGNLVSDTNKGISSISWNEIGLPQTVTFSNGSTISYYFAADGSKLREVRTVSGTATTIDWCGDLVLEKVGSAARAARRLRLDGGYVDLAGGNSARRHFVRDHLGSVRAVVNDAGTVLETDDYYPLGGPLPTGTSTTLQPEKYQGKDWNPAASFNVYDFGARLYDPALGRWISQDPLAEKYYLHSPYLFCAGNPMRFVDPEGEDIWTINSNGQIIWKEQNDRHYLYYEDEYGNRTNQFVQLSSPEILYGLEYNPEYENEKRHIYMSQSKNASDVFKIFKFASDHSNKEWVVHKNKDRYTIGTVLDPISSASYQDFGLSKPDASIHSHPEVIPASYMEELGSMGYMPDKGIVTADMSKVRNNQAPFYNYVYFPVSKHLYNVERERPRYIRSITNFKDFFFGTLNDR